VQIDKTELDLETSRIIRAPRQRIWNAWVDRERLAQWWIPRPAICRVAALDLRPGGAFVTEMSEGGRPFGPHLSACFLEIVPQERIVFTDVLTAGFRPATNGFVTAVITFRDHPDGTAYSALAMHKDRSDRDRHEELGFHEGWGTVAAQLAELVEAPTEP
jgi:uncharacterized protein YndB with AHSA1/START domain